MITPLQKWVCEHRRYRIQMEIQRHRLESCGTSTLFIVAHLEKLNSGSRTPQLVDKATNATVAQSHSRIRSSIFKKPRDMSLEISQTVSHAVDIVLLTFTLVWMQRQNERAKNTVVIGHNFIDAPPPPPLDD